MAKKSTSPRVSSAASRLMNWRAKGMRFYVADHKKPWRDVTRWVESVAASALSQDKTKGERQASLGSEASEILRSLFSSAAFDGSAQKAARRWLAKDERRRVDLRRAKKARKS